MTTSTESPLPRSISEQYAMWLRGEFDVPTDTYWEDEIAALEQRLAEAERILRDTLDAIPGEAIGKKQIVAFLENTDD